MEWNSGMTTPTECFVNLGVFTQRNGTMEWNGGMEWNGIVE